MVENGWKKSKTTFLDKLQNDVALCVALLEKLT